MIIKPMIRNNICINAHPRGCKKNVQNHIAYIKAYFDAHPASAAVLQKPKNVLVIGCSNGYGLASRITAAFGYGAATAGVSFEKAGTATKGGTPGWYHNRAFEQAAAEASIPSITIEGDAFSDETKRKVTEAARNRSFCFDLVIYSLASPVRTHPETGVVHHSVIKPIGQPFAGLTLDPFTGALTEVSVPAATEKEIADTIAVMGGDDWMRWIRQLSEAQLLAPNCRTLAYSYIGPEITQVLYRYGTIGKAKEHLENTACALNRLLQPIGGQALISVNKGLVTRASAVIPVLPLYLAALFKVMKERKTHEECMEQMQRLFTEKLYTADGIIPVDEAHRIRLDEYELAPAVQQAVAACMKRINNENSAQITDLIGYRHSFLAASGFDISGVDYEAETTAFDTI